MEETQRIYGSRADLILMGTKEAALNGTNALVICTEWKHFKVLDTELVQSAVKDCVIFDGRNLFSNTELKRKNINYYSIGRK
jgi:UDPglucose 6-dehydrogenase